MEMEFLRSNSVAPILFSAVVLLAAAPSPVPVPYPLFINGKPVGSAVMINGVLAISLDDFAKAVGGTTNLQQAGLILTGNKLSTRPRHPEVSNSADTFTLSSPRDAASGQASGKRQWAPIKITKEWSSASPILRLNGKAFIALADMARGFGGTFSAPATLTNGVPINLNFSPSPTAAFAMNP